jgi:hypothetical protein
MRMLLALLVIVPAFGAGEARAQPINSDLAESRNGGGCYTTGVQPAILDMLTLINPEWASIANPHGVDDDPVLISGTVSQIHGESSGDFPSTHAFSDVVTDVIVDPEHDGKVATGNDEEHEMAFEWETGAYPDWAWPGPGDRIYGLGRHIFDCGHPGAKPGHCSTTTAKDCVLDTDCRTPLCTTCDPGNAETCEGEHYGYSSELHPPHAAAAIRQGRGGVLSKRKNAKPVPVTVADVWISPNGGGAGDRCVLTHQAADLDQLSTACWPLKEPVARLNAADFTFQIPLPPRPKGAGKPRLRFVPPPSSTDSTAVDGGRPARFKVKKHLTRSADAGGSFLDVTVRMTKEHRGELPTGFAGRFIAGWNDRSSALTHVRVSITDILVSNDLTRVTPLIPLTCSTADTPCTTDADCPSGETCLGAGPVRGWRGQANVNGEWRRFSGSALDVVTDGSIVPQSIVLDQYLPAGGTLDVHADAFSRECIDTAYAHSLADELVRFGLLKGIQCLGADEAHSAGAVDVSYPGPDFGAGAGGTQTYETQSTGGQGGACSTTTDMLCVVDADCPSGETCVTTGGAFRLRYTIEKLS